MGKISHIAINNPCSESWDGMKDAANGKFCNSCRKEVIDFAHLTDKQVLEILGSLNHACGRFNNNQLDSLNKTLAEDENHYFSWKRLIAAASILGFFTLFKAEAKVYVPKTEQMPKPFQNKQPQTKSDTVRDMVIKGKVLAADDNLPLQGATIKLKQTNAGTQADKDGNFRLNITQAADSVLEFSFIGYTTQIVKIMPGKSTYNVVLAPNMQMSTGIIIVERQSLPKRIWRKIKRVF